MFYFGNNARANMKVYTDNQHLEKKKRAHKLGEDGEQAATRYLDEHGYLILERNYRCGHLEVDIIALDQDELVFVEVKTRTDDSVISPIEAVDRRKRKNIIMAADAYIRSNNRPETVRFDIIAIVKHDGETDINHIKNAFDVMNY